MTPIFFEAEIVLDERRARVSIVANSVPVNEGIHQGKGEEEKQKQDAL